MLTHASQTIFCPASNSWGNAGMWLCHFTMLLYHIIMLKKILEVLNVPYKQSTVLQQHVQVSLLWYLPKYWPQEYKKIFKSPKFEGGSASVIEN